MAKRWQYQQLAQPAVVPAPPPPETVTVDKWFVEPALRPGPRSIHPSLIATTAEVVYVPAPPPAAPPVDSWFLAPVLPIRLAQRGPAISSATAPVFVPPVVTSRNRMLLLGVG